MRFAALLAALAVAAPAHAGADSTNRPHRLITAFSLGGAIDVYSRPVAEPPGKRLGQNVFVPAGAINPTAVIGPQRSASMPELATFSERGVPSLDLAIWAGAGAPAGTSWATIDRLQRELRAAIHAPEVREKTIAQRQTPIGNAPGELVAEMRTDVPPWVVLIRAWGAKIE